MDRKALLWGDELGCCAAAGLAVLCTCTCSELRRSSPSIRPSSHAGHQVQDYKDAINVFTAASNASAAGERKFPRPTGEPAGGSGKPGAKTGKGAPSSGGGYDEESGRGNGREEAEEHKYVL
jgi:hypothetical protein